jgi:hypothetical protein
MKSIIIDTNVLVLLVVGSTRKSLIEKHTALADYPQESYDLLIELLGGYDQWLVTPGILSEASGLLNKDSRTRKVTPPVFQALLRAMPNPDSCLQEHHVSSATAADQPEFCWFGVVDSGILVLVAEGTALITSDFSLFNQAYSRNTACVNFKKLIAEAALAGN